MWDRFSLEVLVSDRVGWEAAVSVRLTVGWALQIISFGQVTPCVWGGCTKGLVGEVRLGCLAQQP